MTEAKMRVDAMAGFAAPPFHPILPDAGGGPTFGDARDYNALIATAAGTGGRYTVIEQVTPPAWGPPRHIHSCEDEIFYILDGSYELHVGDEHRTVSAGASAILPRNIRHGFRNVASTPSRLVFVITPGGLEEYFSAVAKWSPAPNPAQLVELARPFGPTLLPPGANESPTPHDSDQRLSLREVRYPVPHDRQTFANRFLSGLRVYQALPQFGKLCGSTVGSHPTKRAGGGCR